MQNRGGSGYAWATPPPASTGMSVGEGLSVVRLPGWVTGVAMERLLSLARRAQEEFRTQVFA